MAAPSFWNPPVELSEAEQRVAKRLGKTGRLFEFLRVHRHEIFDDALQRELVAMYDTDSPKGRPPVRPALLAMVTLLQAYMRRSDVGAVQDSSLDRRWQLVLGCLDEDEPAFAQGTLFDFRRRLIEHGLDKRLLEQTVQIARRTGGFGDKALRAALDSAPLWGAARVEDTFNLIAHAMDVVARCAAEVLGVSVDEVVKQSDVALLGRGVKAKLDIDWSDEQQRYEALQRLLADVQRLRTWVVEQLADRVELPRMKEALDLLERVVEQDLEPDPERGGQRIRQGVAKDRRISIRDGDMRHGRKSKSRVINGYKRHIVRDLDRGGVIFAVDLQPANAPEHEVVAELENDLHRLDALHIDRGYLGSPKIRQMREAGMRIVAKPWVHSNGGRFTKLAFRIDLDAGQVTCPKNNVAKIRHGQARFSAADCDACPARAKCTIAALGRGRSVHIHDDEAFHEELRKRQRTSEGRAELRERVAVEHTLAHVCRRQGPRARYVGRRKNLYDLRRIAAVENLIIADRLERQAA
jgi:hypothetical protein